VGWGWRESRVEKWLGERVEGLGGKGGGWGLGIE
jgi:hypothetical protein